MTKPLVGVIPYYSEKNGGEYMPGGYFRGVEALGGEFRVIHYDTPAEELPGLVKGLDALIFSGGVDVDPKYFGQEKEPACGSINPVRDELELRLFELAAGRRLPVLGICRGIQLINVAMGGTLIQDIPSRFPGTEHQQEAQRLEMWHEVRLVPGTPLSEHFGGREKLMTNSFHHQAIDRTAPGLKVNATAAEGFPEAVTGEGNQPILGVQWHPEVSFQVDENSRSIFALFKSMMEG